MTPARATTEAKCPDCDGWSRVAPTGPYLVPAECSSHPLGDGAPIVDVALVHGPWWWTDEAGDPDRGPAGCPKCGAIVLVESECSFRTVQVPTPDL